MDMRSAAFSAFVLAGIMAWPSAAASTVTYDSFEAVLGQQVLGQQYSTVGDVSFVMWPHLGAYSLLTDGSDDRAFVQYYFTESGAGTVSIAFFDRMDGCLVFSGGMRQFFFAMNEDDYVHASGSSILGLGVDTAHSSCNYLYRVDGGRYPTSIPRTLGWHQFTITWAASQALLSIDGIEVYTSSYVAHPDKAQFGDAWGGFGLGWWDDFTVVAT